MGKKKDGKKSRKGVKRFFAVLAIVLGVILLAAVAYVVYVFAAYYRIGDETIEPQNKAETAVAEGGTYTITSYNIGFGAYEDDYGFFMDGGTEGRAWSKDRLQKNLKEIENVLKEQASDFYFIQEVDTDSTRSYHVDEREYMIEALSDKSYAFARNWDSPYLFYPFLKPHGSAKTGIMIFADGKFESAKRVELPVETGFMKIVDLDRCYLKCVVPLESGGKLVLYNFHLSAYTSDGTIATDQLKILLADMELEYQAGNYCIAGGDFNKDILGNSEDYFGKADKEYTWAQPIPDELLERFCSTVVKPFDEADPVPSCRNADGPYHEGQYVLTVDGFIVTPNVKVIKAEVVDTQFKYSDHNPVTMTFSLGEAGS